MTKALDLALYHAKKWLNGLDKGSVSAVAGLTDIRNSLSGSLPAQGMAADQVIEHIATSTKPGLLGSAGGRFFAWVIGGGTSSALAADWLVSTWDQNAALYNCGPAVSIMEETAGEWVKELLDLPREASFAFTTGCQLAHFTSLAAARHSVLARYGWDVEQDGLFGAPQITVFVNPGRHGSVDRAVRFLGIGEKHIRPLPVNQEGVITAQEMEKVVSETEGPKIMILNAADLNIGACDNFAALIPIAHKANIWVHIDGAFGLFARASKTRRHLVEGIDLADSWATDAHKWLNVPFDCGIAIVRDHEAHKAAMTLSASYIKAKGNARDQIDWNPEWSRRARGVPVYAVLKELGRSGVADLIDRSCRYCHSMVSQIAALDRAEMIAEPTLNQGLVRFVKPGASQEENDRYTEEVIARVNASGEAFFSGTIWRGRQAMRISVVNWRTCDQDVARAVAAVRTVLNEDIIGKCSK